MSGRFWSFVTAIALLSLLVGVAIPVAAQDAPAQSVEELCPNVVSLREYPLEQIDDYTYRIEYQTASGIALTLTITVPTDTPVDPVSLVDEFVGEVQLCLEVVTEEQLGDLLIPEDAVSVPLGDHFYETMESYLSLVEFTQAFYSGEFAEEDLWSVYTDQLNTGLANTGMETASAQQDVIDSATALLQDAYDRGELTDAAFEAALADLERGYAGAFNPNPEDLATIPLADVGDAFMVNGVINIDIALTFPEELGVEEFGLVLVLDPSIAGAARHRFTVSSAKSMRINSLCATNGTVNGNLKNGATSLLNLSDSNTTRICAGPTATYTANKFCVDGVQTSNFYTLSSTYWVSSSPRENITTATTC